MRRLGHGSLSIVSADKVAEDLQISRAMVLKIENRAANKVNAHFNRVKTR